MPWLTNTFNVIAGLIGQLNSESFSLLSKIQSKMASLIKSVGNISHEVYPYICIRDKGIIAAERDM